VRRALARERAPPCNRLPRRAGQRSPRQLLVVRRAPRCLLDQPGVLQPQPGPGVAQRDAVVPAQLVVEVPGGEPATENSEAEFLDSTFMVDDYCSFVLLTIACGIRNRPFSTSASPQDLMQGTCREIEM
jgi:hypothetical protein